MAGVEPTFTNLNGQDATAFIFSANLARRDLTQGEKAVVYAKVYPEPGFCKFAKGRGRSRFTRVCTNTGQITGWPPDNRLDVRRSFTDETIARRNTRC
jgi:hypothetical protein